MRLYIVAVVGLTTAWFAAQVAEAKVGFRQLTSVFPVAVQRGTTSTVQVRSNFTLDNTYQVYFDRPGLHMTLAETKPIEAPLTNRGAPGTPFRFAVQVPPAQPAGLYEVRMATPQAVSSVTHLLVTDYPVAVEGEKDNGTQSAAQSVSLPAAVCGQVSEPEDVDCYRFTGKKGQRLTFQVFGQRVTAAIHDMVGRNQTYHLDPILTLYAPNGQVIGQNDNFFGGDALLVSTLPTDGDYTIEIRDTRYLGNLRYTYCIEIGERPHYRTTFPLVVEKGKTIEAQLLGTGVDNIGKVKLASTNDDAIGWTSQRFNLATGETNPVQFGISDHKQVTLDKSPTVDKPFELKLPIGVSGRIDAAGQTHAFAFEAEKDAYYRFIIYAQRAGMPLDGVLEVFDADGKKVGEADDQQFSQDPQFTFRAPANGRYTIRLHDLHDRGGPDFVYHLSTARVGQEFELGGRFYYAMVAPGVRTMWFAKVERLNGFEGPVEVHVDNLPEGASFTPVVVPAKMNHAAMILSGAKDAKVNASLVRVWGKATVIDAEGKSRELIREGNVTCELQNGGGGQGFWPIKTSLVGVVEPMDLLKVEAEPSEITLKRGGKAEITLRIERSKGYDEPVNVEVTHQYFTSRLGEQLPPGVTVGAASQNRISGKTLEAKIVLEAANDALAVEKLPIGIMAGVSISFSINTLYSSNPVLLTIPDDPIENAKPKAESGKKAKK